MDSDTLWAHTDRERASLCDLLTGLTPEQWSTPSLCRGWTVRDVAAHLSMAQLTLPQAMGPLLRAGLRFNTMIRDSAKRNPLTHDQIVARIRSFEGTRKRAPFISEKEPLLDILVHTQDICVPLGVDRRVPSDAAVVALERILELNHTRVRLRRPLDGVRLVATDADWATGQGPVVEGELRWLLLLAAGREVARDHLAGALEAV
ncbi:maleylpyruvate isomerase family mycothiol-dependent enzyme [Nocardioides insulae]|uniref:maleylpyruvate isomerase family mycothiol-dependent enzyme n=1 Tax=Nocardioides insulae TaxID=394734 RepID=UPI00040E356E|nr:maleylpyruvate isomerase family mycothiol-dependent enzyme [Nocardioides insulae]